MKLYATQKWYIAFYLRRNNMVISKRLAAIPDSYFGKTMGRKVEHGPLPLINMAVGIPDGETPEGIIAVSYTHLTLPTKA